MYWANRTDVSVVVRAQFKDAARSLFLNNDCSTFLRNVRRTTNNNTESSRTCRLVSRFLQRRLHFQPPHQLPSTQSGVFRSGLLGSYRCESKQEARKSSRWVEGDDVRRGEEATGFCSFRNIVSPCVIVLFVVVLSFAWGSSNVLLSVCTAIINLC